LATTSTASEGADSKQPAAPPALELRRPLCAHLRVLPWLLPGLAALLIGHLTASHAGAAGAAQPWLQRPGGFGTLQGAGPAIVGACSGGGASGPDAMQLVFANYAGCAAARGGCTGAGSPEWGWSSESWST
jgi:hypothetical protein